ncbi:MAG TPA: glycosyltransferase family 4 protein [Xanthomonadaceae bacterium]|nr:glycosyltransferase family 4 protein [Xanthomonadaceae bacterium]
MQEELATRTEEAAVPEVTAAGREVAAVEPELWQTLLWVRDQAASARGALVLGEGAALAGVLLARLGTNVTVLDAQGRQFQEAIDREEGLPGQVALAPLDAANQLEAVRAGGNDTAIVIRRHAGGLRALLETLAATPDIERVILALPFGHYAYGESGLSFPRHLVEALAGFAVERIDVAGGQMRAVLAREPGVARPAAESLLDLTERGAEDALRKLRRRVAELEGECDEARANWMRFEAEAAELRSSTSFRLGYLLVMAVRSPRSLLEWPRRLRELVAQRKSRPAATVANAEGAGLGEWRKEALRARAAAVMDQGSDAIAAEVARFLPDASASTLAFAQLVAAQECGRKGRHDLEFELARSALEMNHSIGMVRGFLHVALRARRMEAASAALRELHEAADRGNRIARDFLQRFRQTSSYKIATLESIPPRPERWHREEGGRLVYVLHNSLPYSSGGYATRSHGVAGGLAAGGRDVVCVTRPGFPLDVKPGLAPIDMPIVDRIDNVPYQRIVEPRRVNIPEYRYVQAAMDNLEAELRRLRPAFVQAASNYVTALPALVAARRLGVPFFYEVRGLWEITRLSRDQDFGESISFDVQRHIESTVAREADHVFTLTEPMREELIARGVEPSRITLLPNSVDASRFHAREPDATLAQKLGIPPGVPVIGYIGTFVVYEGLEDLAAACVELHQRGIDFRLLIVGNENASGQERGPITEEILRIAREGGIESKVIMPGRVPHEEVEAYYSLVDVCPFPRKPWPVCEMVSPMKPLEALAMKKAVVVSSVRALTEMIQHDRTGVVFEKGSVASLADAIADLVASPDKRKRLGEAGREWVVAERSWTQVAERVEAVLARLEAEMRAQEAAGQDPLAVAAAADGRVG